MGGNKVRDLISRFFNSVKSIWQGIIKTARKKDFFSSFKGKTLFKRNRPSYRIVNFKRFLLSFIILCFIVFIIPYIIFGNRAYLLLVNGEEIGKVKNKKIVELAVENLKEQLERDNKADIMFNNKIEYKKIRAPRKEHYKEEVLEDELRKYITYDIKAFNLYIDDEVVACFRAKDDIEDILKSIEDSAITTIGDGDIKEISFAEKVEIVEEFCDAESLIDKGKAKDLIINGTAEVKTHKVQSNESLWSISQNYGISLDDLKKANPGINPKRIDIGQEINLLVPKPLINIKTVEEKIYKDRIPFEQKTQLDNNLYEHQTRIITRGEYGEKEVHANIIKLNGVEVEREIIKERIIKQAKDQVQVKGTKK